MAKNKSLNILITGGAGFIGTNFVFHWCKRYPTNRVIVLDALTYAGNRKNLTALETSADFRFVKGDICDRTLVDQILKTEKVETIVHLAAESHVDRSIRSPDSFIQTNLVGTFTLLEAFRHHWQASHQPQHYRFLHVSTDEVYGSLEPDEPAFSETTPYKPNSPYSASKAGSDHLVRSYFQTYGLPTLITNCSNNYGPYHFPEKLIPLICVNILLGKSLPIYGDGQQIRDWLYVSDHCQALDIVLSKGKLGETYNVGGNNAVKNIDLVYQLCDLMDELAAKYGIELPQQSARALISFVQDRPGHDRRYAIDTSKISTELDWHPQETLADGLRKTVDWYLTHQDWWRPILERQEKED